MSLWRWILRPICWRKGHAEGTVVTYEMLPVGWLVCSRCYGELPVEPAGQEG